ncbi:MAG: hypothetical protein LBR22_06175 [Desulfovibrio sp.]|jgi:hypothetical protein|nr:hypothetical protein [Desulfovibrio sp.]
MLEKQRDAAEAEAATARADLAHLAGRSVAVGDQSGPSMDFGRAWLAYRLMSETGIMNIAEAGARPNRVRSLSPGRAVGVLLMNSLNKPVSLAQVGEELRKSAMDTIRPGLLENVNGRRLSMAMDYYSVDETIEMCNASLLAISEMAKEMTPRSRDDSSKKKVNVYYFDEINFNCNHTVKRDSDILAFEHSKKNLNHKLQVGLAILLDGSTRLPVLCSVYRGSIHDSKVFTSMRMSIFEYVKKQNNYKSYIVVPAKPACAHARRAGGRGTPSRPPGSGGKWTIIWELAPRPPLPPSELMGG